MKHANPLSHVLPGSLSARLLITLALLGSTPAAAVAETLQLHDPAASMVYYRSPDISLQAARFDLARPAQLLSLSLRLGGEDPDGRGRLRIFSHEGGLPYPYAMRDLVRPIPLRKTKRGPEAIHILLDKAVQLNNDQFFVAVDSLSAGTVLLSNRESLEPACASPASGAFHYQVMRMSGGAWQQARSAYFVSVKLKYEEHAAAAFSLDTLAFDWEEAALQEQSGDQSAFQGIASADVNGDAYDDLLVKGILFISDHGVRFRRHPDLPLNPAAVTLSAFIDIDNDSQVDIFVAEGPAAALLRNRGDGSFIRQELDLLLPSALSAFSLGDLNRDGYADILLAAYDPEQEQAPLILLNEAGRGLRPTRDLIAFKLKGAARASSIADINNDGLGDVYLAGYAAQPDEIWLAGAGGGFSPAAAELFAGNLALLGASATGAHWGDADNDGDLDLLRAVYLPPAAAGAERPGPLLLNGGQEQAFRLSVARRQDFGYEEKQSGGAWGDINNDGLLDCILLTSCPCRYAEVYLQNSDHSFSQETSALGLDKLAGQVDGLWFDADNDGALDLLVVSDTVPQLYRQRRGYFKGGFTQISLQRATARQQILGARVTVVAGGRSYVRELQSGRGRMMQDPLRLHFGLGDVRRIDSVLVRWPGRAREETFYAAALGGSTTLREGQGSGAAGSEGAALSISAYPNPFSREITLSFALRRSGELRLVIHDLTGREILTLAEGPHEAGSYSLVWDATGAGGRRVPAGTYLYRLRLDDEELAGHVTLVD